MHLPLHPMAGFTAGSTRLEPFDGFGANPGKLKAWLYAPEESEGTPVPLVVALHGCTQTARGYDDGTGWSELAERFGFAVLLPEQVRANNPNLCFNWFDTAHTRRGAGEARSIARMIESLVERGQVDPARVFITGLSAGGAMTSAMLAAYPEMFAGGAILAGLPHGAAASVGEAFEQMRAPRPNARSDGRAIRKASAHRGPWPRVSIWHGTADRVVSPSNADALVRQWQDIHGLPGIPAEEGLVDGHPHRVWRDAQGRPLLEEYRITGMGHGAALATTGECGCGNAGAFMLEAGISSTVHSARTWGLLEHAARLREKASTPRGRPAAAPSTPLPARSAVAQVIEDALRAAGLMK